MIQNAVDSSFSVANRVWITVLPSPRLVKMVANAITGNTTAVTP